MTTGSIPSGADFCLAHSQCIAAVVAAVVEAVLFQCTALYPPCRYLEIKLTTFNQSAFVLSDACDVVFMSTVVERYLQAGE